MAQATRNLSRRSVLGSMAVLPVAVVPAVAIVASISSIPTGSADWDAIRDRLDDAMAAYGKANKIHIAAKDALKRWEKRNPFPTRESYLYVAQGDDFEELRCREKAWQARYERALTNSGVGRACKRMKDAADTYTRLCFEAATTPVSSLVDLKEKARLALFCDRPDGPIRDRVIRDLIKVSAPQTQGA